MEQSLGLEKLVSNRRLIVKQKSTFCSGNKYVVYDADVKPIFFAEEEMGLLTCFGDNNRSFTVQLFDENNYPVISLHRPYSIIGPKKMEVSVCSKVVSVVRQKPTLITPVLYINDASDRPVLRIKGPIASLGECEFNLQTADKESIGFIRKTWGGLIFTVNNEFHIEFPIDLDVRYKAAVLGACILIDFLYYEK